MSQTFDDFVPARYPGPVTTAKQTRAKIFYLALAGFGFTLALLGGSSGLQAFGLGMVFPGAGFLQYLGDSWFWTAAHLLLFLFSAAAFRFSLFYLWFFTGNAVGPVAIWFLSALGAGLMNHQHQFEAAPVLVLALLIGSVGFFRRANRKVRRTRKESLERRRAAIAEAKIRAPASPIDPATGLREVKELSPEDLKLLRYAYDRSLQPVDEWNGFTKKDEWQGNATRYQLSYLGWALSLTNFTALPAMRGYLQQAQLNLIEKWKEPRVWSYWRWERLFGGLVWDPDPFPVDNVMFSGYLGKSLGFYQNATGDRRHDEKGAFTLRGSSGKEYAYDYPKICSILAKQKEEAEFGHIGCEFNFLYPFCNAFGNTALAAKSAGMAATDTFGGAVGWAERQPRYRESYRDEFMDIDGTVMLGKTKWLGLPVSLPGMKDSFSLLIQAAYLNPVLPDLAAFQYEVAKSEVLERAGKIDLESITSADPATGENGIGWTAGMLHLAAQEQGDAQTAELAAKLIEEQCPSVVSDGVMHYPGESVVVHAKMIMGRVATTNCQYDLANKGGDERWLHGPLLTDATYPKVQVAKAVSDGTHLELVLYPENEPDAQEIELSQLEADRQYRVTGSSRNEQVLSADTEGKARLSIHLDGRTALRIERV
ncbi:MAG: hypothetical protein OXE40_16505 [Gammaproteobacteria bacterium]|nr:hypothetical protein [Gammaproteobacteria bacterium]